MMKNKVIIYENKLIYIIIAMVLIGTVLLYNASSTLAVNKFNNYSFFFSRHLIRLMISFLALFLIYNIKYTFLKINATKILYFSWAIMILAYFFNDGSSTSRWLIINGKNLFTTSDLAKLALIIYTAFFIEINKNRMNDLNLILKGYIPKFLITIILIFFQPDLSTSFAISLIIISLFLISGLKIKYALYPVFIACIPITIKIISTPFQRSRFINWFYGEYNIQTENSINALGNGGIFGVGYGNSIIKEGFLPEVHTDFILPIIGEEFGFLGILVLFFLFISFYIYGIKISKSAPDIFSSMLSLGIVLNILFYFLINASYVVGILPTTGLPVPFFSYGGSHTLFNMIGLGILFNISKYKELYKYKYINYE
jgi:cell division protein FtsW